MPSPIAVTGANGRLGHALVAATAGRGRPARAWSRRDYDLDDPGAADRVLGGSPPDVVIHTAAWTDVDGCARDPELAMRRNGTAAGQLAAACAREHVRLLLISTNEVFDGQRTDGQGYREEDPRRPINPYGASKLWGEETATDAFARVGWPEGLTIVRTAWLYGPPGDDFPTKIVAASDRLADGDSLRVVEDEVGSPTFTQDLAVAILDLLATQLSGAVHLVNGGQASRLAEARLILSLARPERSLAPISRTAFTRPSQPPAWAVLDGSRAAGAGVRLRAWDAALRDYAGTLA